MSSHARMRVCVACAKQQPLVSASVRLYFRRSQWEYHYTLCGDCLKELKMFLWCNADNAVGGMFDPPNALSGPTRVTA